MISDDKLNDVRIELADLTEWLGTAAGMVRKSISRFNDPDLPEPLAIKHAQTAAEAAGRAFRECERIAKVLADDCIEWSKYQSDEKA